MPKKPSFTQRAAEALFALRAARTGFDSIIAEDEVLKGGGPEWLYNFLPWPQPTEYRTHILRKLYDGDEVKKVGGKEFEAIMAAIEEGRLRRRLARSVRPIVNVGGRVNRDGGKKSKACKYCDAVGLVRMRKNKGRGSSSFLICCR